MKRRVLNVRFVEVKPGPREKLPAYEYSKRDKKYLKYDAAATERIMLTFRRNKRELLTETF